MMHPVVGEMRLQVCSSCWTVRFMHGQVETRSMQDIMTNLMQCLPKAVFPGLHQGRIHRQAEVFPCVAPPHALCLDMCTHDAAE